MEVRIEFDTLGAREIPNDSLYGSNTSRALENFPLTCRTLKDETEFVSALASIKKAAAFANSELGLLSSDISEAIGRACDEMGQGALNSHLAVPILEGSGGTSINMNINEVLCNRALQLIGRSPGEYDVIHPNDNVNCGQSTNDVIPSGLKLACFRLAGDVRSSVEAVHTALLEKVRESARVPGSGSATRDSIFRGYAGVIKRAGDSLDATRRKLLLIPLGGTAIGTGLGAGAGYKRLVFRHLRELLDHDVNPSEDSFDGMQNLDELQRLSGELQVVTGALASIAKKFITSEGIALRRAQPGSSSALSVIQLSRIVQGNHTAISMAAGDGMLEINHYELLIASRLFESLHLTTGIARAFAELSIPNMAADTKARLQNT